MRVNLGTWEVSDEAALAIGNGTRAKREAVRNRLHEVVANSLAEAEDEGRTLRAAAATKQLAELEAKAEALRKIAGVTKGKK